MAWKTLKTREGTLRLVERLFRRPRTDYQQLLQDFSRALTTLVSLPRLLETIADQIEEAFQPLGQAIVLPDEGDGYCVVLSRGKLAALAIWQENAHIEADHPIPSRLARQHRALDLAQHRPSAAEMQDPAWLEFERSGAHLFVPMHMRGTLVGWVVLGPKLSERAYSQRNIDFLSACVDQSCVALENARLYGEMQQRATELAMLSIVSSAISSSLDLERVLEAIVESTTKVVGCDRSAIFELSQDGTELELRMGKGLSPSFRQSSRRLLVGDDARAQVISTGRPFIVPDIHAEPGLFQLGEIAQQGGFRAIIDVPLAGPGGLMGILSVYFSHVHQPSSSELEILTTFANQAAIAIENARLYAAVTHERDRVKQLYEQTDATLARRVEERSVIEEISQRLTSTLDLNEVLSLLLEKVFQAVDADRGVISLYKPKQRILQLIVQKGSDSSEEPGRVESRPGLASDAGRGSDVAAGLSPQSLLSVPITHEGQEIGIISLASDKGAAFTAEHLRFVELLADQAAIGIYNAQLFEQVMEGRDRLQAILNSTHDIVIVLDTEGRVTLVNPRLRELFGPAVEEWLLETSAQNLGERADGQSVQVQDQAIECLAEVIRRAQDWPDQVRTIAFTFQNGTKQRYVEGTGSPVLNASGEIIGQLTVLRDMTQQKEIEQFRIDLTSMVIHNLQGPLAAMISSLEMLREDCHFEEDVASELLRIALSSGRKLYDRIESLLWIQRLEEKQIPLELQTLALPQVVQPIVDEYTAMAATLNVRLAASFAPDLPLVLVDEEVLGRVFSNLLDNALKFTPHGGQIQVRVTKAPDQEKPQLLCSIADTGVGIPENTQKLIFDRFRRGEQAGHRRGMGIGLHYCRVAVKAHGGSIWVESQCGQGSTFFFTLPQAQVRRTCAPESN